MLDMNGAILLLSMLVSATESFQSSSAPPCGSRVEARLPSPLFVPADSINDVPAVTA